MEATTFVSAIGGVTQTAVVIAIGEVAQTAAMIVIGEVAQTAVVIAISYALRSRFLRISVVDNNRLKRRRLHEAWKAVSQPSSTAKLS
jgi:hypothetical protein